MSFTGQAERSFGAKYVIVVVVICIVSFCVSQVNSFSVEKCIALNGFAAAGGTLVLLRCSSARNIEDLSFFPHEKERLFMPNTKYNVDQAIASVDVRRVAKMTSLNMPLASFPPNMDLVVITEVT